LLQKRSVTRAARQLAVTQSAMSHTLRRLRESFDDPLLVRGAGGMVPTPRAEALTAPLRAALLELSSAIAEPEPFDPKSTRRVFRLVSPDLFDTLVLPTLLQRFAERAPNAALSIAPSFDDLATRLETKQLDVAIAPLIEGTDGAPIGLALGNEWKRKRLLSDRFKAYVRNGHPVLASGRVGLEVFARLDHVLVSPTGRGEGIVDQLLSTHGLSRRVVLRVPSFAAALAAVRRSDLVVVAPGALDAQKDELGLATLALGKKLPAHTLEMVWHPRMSADPAHEFLREQLRQSVAALARGPNTKYRAKQR
jgi:DNA-binding transcriptional LysR family regulator